MPVAGFAGGAADSGGTGLASHAAQMGFARGAQMQQQQLHQAQDGRLTLENKTGAVKSRIREVWKHNLAQEMATLRNLVEKYPYISMVRTGLLTPVFFFFDLFDLLLRSITKTRKEKTE